MTIPILSTSDKSFICSYSIGMNIDFRLASGVINEITTYTTEYIEGKCWIPVFAPTETNDHSNFWDLPEKDVVYIKVGCRISSDGYIHTWLLDTQKVSELILWNNRYNTTNQPTDDTTTLHWTIEKLYRQVIGNITGFVAGNIKFQSYITNTTTLYLFGNYNNGLTNPVTYTSLSADMLNSDFSWYPNNSTTIISDYLFASSVLCDCQYTKDSIDAAGWCDFPTNVDTTPTSTPWGKSPYQTEPKFWYTSSEPTSYPISAHCTPGSYSGDTHTLCFAGIDPYGIGNNSGRGYVMMITLGNCPIFTCPGKGAGSWKQVRIPEDNNTAYIWVYPYCSGASGDSQSECEANGGTWVPGHYACDPTFTYDTSVSFNYSKYNSIVPDEIDYVNGRAKFNGLAEGTKVTAEYRYLDSILDEFDEYSSDLDELKHGGFTDSDGESLYTLFTRHVGIGLITKEVVPSTTIDSADWIVTWGANNYFDSWATPDGLGARSPGSTQTLLARPLTHHDGFYTGATDIEGGFIYEPATSNAFLSRTISNETKIHIPLSHNTGFGWLYESTLSNGFLSRSIDVEAKLHTPISFNTGFDWMYESITSDSFLSRTIDNEIKIETPLSFNTGFSWLYKFEEPWVSKHRFLKIGGNDADDGLTFATAWEHWSHAMATIAEDGRLYAADGTYSESVGMSPQKAFELFLIDATGEDAPAEVIITPA